MVTTLKQPAKRCILDVMYKQNAKMEMNYKHNFLSYVLSFFLYSRGTDDPDSLLLCQNIQILFVNY